MTLAQRIKSFIWRTCHAVSPALEHRLKRRFSRSYWDNWRERTRVVMACPDNAFIPRVPDAGRMDGSAQVMHNGLKVRLASYYGDDAVRLFEKNRGVHEPQEERVFQEVLKQIEPGGAIVELGAYWGFYSMWFCATVPDGRAFLVEASADNLERGRENFALNNLRGHFTHAWVGAESGVAPDGAPTLRVDDFAAKEGLERIAILHADIQGAELEMLKGAQALLSGTRIAYTFVSTHSEELHAACDDYLKSRGYLQVASIRPAESYSVDGILVHRSPATPDMPTIPLSRRTER